MKWVAKRRLVAPVQISRQSADFLAPSDLFSSCAFARPAPRPLSSGRFESCGKFSAPGFKAGFFHRIQSDIVRSVAKPQPNGVRPSPGAETWDARRCGSNPEREALVAAAGDGRTPKNFIAACAQFRRLQCSVAKPQAIGVRPSPGAETSGVWRCGSNPERPARRRLLRPGRPHSEKIRGAGVMQGGFKKRGKGSRTALSARILSERQKLADTAVRAPILNPPWGAMLPCRRVFIRHLPA
jgi:hypothetical protein